MRRDITPEQDGANGKIERRTIRLEDGRYLIFYDFAETPTASLPMSDDSSLSVHEPKPGPEDERGV